MYLARRTIRIRAGILLACIGFLFINAFGWLPIRQEKTPALSLDDLLGKLAVYCRKLEGVALNFVCHEEIRETIDPTLDVMDPLDTVDDWQFIPPGHAVAAQILPLRKKDFSYVYDYQCIRSNHIIREMRTLIEENGAIKNVSNSVLKTSVVVFGNALLAPVGLLSEAYQKSFDYAIIGKSKIEGLQVITIEAKPKLGAPDIKNLFGKAWIDPTTADIRKIEWNENRIGNYEVFEKRGKRYMRSPRLTISSEFKTEKNGIRFPSRLYVEEAYVNSLGRAIVRSKTEVLYTNFRFFTVEVDIK
ncbi:MAG: hypothetical protein ABSF88_11385 [Candidatus Aminicenantales bacterium]|jgi:hypothetical protein